MKPLKLLLFLCAIIIFSAVSCKKNDSNQASYFKYIAVVAGGCNIENKFKSVLTSSNDTVWYSIKSDSLDIHFGYNATCCGSYKTSYSLKNDTICIAVASTIIPSCNCICFYTFDFTFYGLNKNYFYTINLDNYKTFRGYITLGW